jgi:alpha-beta hydrolase superfamily lysophospholipase
LTSHLSETPPRLPILMREAISFAYMRFTATFGRAVPVAPTGSGQHIIVIPGFMASDRTTGRLRRSLSRAGYTVHGWGLGRNRGVKADVFDKLNAHLDSKQITGPVIVIGWSLGGLVAREFAKHSPARVAKVISLGSPFSGNPRANNAWRVYELVAGHKVDNPPIDTVLSQKPPVPTIAFWSHNDGVVSSRSACGLPGESDSQIELNCAHMAFVARPSAIAAIGGVLSQTG